ncbi:MAG: hypothetical protein M3P51_06120 [Chloroflexota bacterium]|nr:hypothetical protein [Chloroflexota bacterium]
MRLRITSLALVLALALAVTAAPAYAAQNKGGAAGLVAAVVQIASDGDIDVSVVELNNSLNNLRALNNVLNNSPILSNNDIDVTVGDVSLLSDFLNDNNITLEDFLNDLNIELDDVVGIVLLDTGDIIVLV